jgi:DNA-binding winged helix-turn-helix (wHTH) protein
MQVSFGDFVLSLDSRELLRRSEPVRLSPKAFQLLQILVTNRPKALSKADLQDRLWPDTFVVEKNLTNLISEIREALGEDPVGSALHGQLVRSSRWWPHLKRA